MENGFKISYSYDRLNRLSTVTLNGETQKYYTYDPAGNLIAVSPTAPDKSEEPATREERIAAPGSEKPAAREGRFAALEEEYDRLNGLAQAGAVSLEEFQEKVNRLRFQDGEGIWWQLRFDGIWLKWNGAAWVEAEPYS